MFSIWMHYLVNFHIHAKVIELNSEKIPIRTLFELILFPSLRCRWIQFSVQAAFNLCTARDLLILNIYMLYKANHVYDLPVGFQSPLPVAVYNSCMPKNGANSQIRTAWTWYGDTLSHSELPVYTVIIARWSVACIYIYKHIFHIQN